MPVTARYQGREGQIRLRFSVEAAGNMSVRLNAFMKVAAQRR
jgi:hypothetical protein